MPPRARRAGDAAREGQHDAFREQVTHDASASGAQGDTNRDLAFPGRAPREQEIGHVDARDEEHEADRDHQHDQCASD